MLSASHIPNIISGLRILSAPFLFALVYFGEREVFAWLLAAALISDIVDGVIARSFGFASELGAHLDSVGDILVFVAAAYGIVCFHPEVVSANRFAFVFVTVLWLGTNLTGLWRYGRLASFHTYLSRIAAYGVGGFLGVLFLWGLNIWLFWIAFFLITASTVEVLVLLFLLPAWTPNVRGLYWVARKRMK
jgi:phosphatidylglycerophosphate synthase